MDYTKMEDMFMIKDSSVLATIEPTTCPLIVILPILFTKVKSQPTCCTLCVGLMSPSIAGWEVQLRKK